MTEPWRSNPPTGRELFLGYSPAFRGARDWRLSYQQVRTRPDGLILRRTNWDRVTEKHCRLIVTVTETQSVEEAISRLEAVRENEGIDYQSGRGRHGPYSIVFPEEKPTAVHDARANLKISVVSGGRTPVLVSPWADLIKQELDYSDTRGLDDGLRLEADPAAPGGAKAVPINFFLPWVRSESAWFKFVTSAGRLTRGRKENQLLLTDIDRGRVTVTGWAMEPGRETFWGTIVIDR